MEVLSNEDISLDKLAPLECVVIQTMECRMLVPTAADYIKLLLFFSNSESNFEELIHRANNISLITMLVYEISEYHPSVIALASLFIALEEKQYFTFSLGLKNVIIEHGLAFDLDETKACHAKICAHIYQEEDDISAPQEEFSKPLEQINENQTTSHNLVIKQES